MQILTPLVTISYENASLRVGNIERHRKLTFGVQKVTIVSVDKKNICQSVLLSKLMILKFKLN